MAVSKVILNGETLIDVTKDTVASDNLLIGKTATGADGEKVVGALTIPDSAWIYKTASGDIATFDDGADDVPVKQLTVSIEPVQSGSGDPSPENLRPISGWTGTQVIRTGKNIFGGELLRDGVLTSIPSAIDNPEDRSVTFISNASSALAITTPCGLSNKFKEKTAYTFIITYSKSSGTGSNLRVYYTDGTYANIPVVSGANAKETHIYVTNKNKTVAALRKYNSSGSTTLYYDESGIFEGVLTAEEFKPYRGETYNIAFPAAAGTVYGGTLEVKNGVMTVDRAMVDLGTLNWVLYSVSQGNLFRSDSTITNANIPYNSTNFICSNYKTVLVGQKAVGTISCSVNGRVDIIDDSFSDKNAFKTAMSGVQLVYELATPFTVQLTPKQISTLYGSNNIWADCGAVDVTYNADATIAYAQLDQDTAKKSMVALVEDGMTATRNYAVGELLIVEDTLYRVTADIPNGGAITLGTNVTVTTMAAEIAASSITVDSALSSTSENPVQNSVITVALSEKQNAPDNEGTTGQVLTKTDQGVIWEDTNIPDSVRIRKTASGDPAVFSDGADGEPVRSLIVSVVPTQSGEGTPTPENVRPFIGWEKAVISLRGENLIDLPKLLAAPSHEISGGTALHYMTLQLKPNTTYTMSSSYEQTGDKQRIVYFNSTAAAASVNSNNPVSVTTDSTGEAYVFMMDREGISDFVNGTAWLKLEKGSAATPYSTEHPISFGDDVTIYGGTLNVTTGVLTVDYKYSNMSSFAYYPVSVSGAINARAMHGLAIDPSEQVLCSTFKTVNESVSFANRPLYSVAYVDGNYYPLEVKLPSDYDTSAKIKAYMTEIGAVLIRKLPSSDIQTYQLTPTEVKTLLGQNSISADCGSVEVTYCADASLAAAEAYSENAEREQYLAVRNATMSMFSRFGVCGASWDSGYYYKSASAVAEREDVSWGANVARRNGNVFCNYSKADMTTRSYLTNVNCLPKLLADDPCDLYVITLGGNDSSQLGSDYLGTIADITSYQSYEDYPDTYYGNYGKIIEQILAHAPKAKIILIMRCAASASDVRKSFNAAKDEIAEHYGLPHLNWMDDDWCGSDYFFAMEAHDHPTPASLSGMADAWERLFSRCVAENQSYFKYYDGSAPSSGGGSVTVDGALSATSENPVQNKVIKAALDDKAATSSVPASASVSNAGVLSFVNSAGTQLFDVQLPLYAGGVS